MRVYSLIVRRRSALVITETELNVIAALGQYRAEQQSEERIQHSRRNRHAQRIVSKREE